MNDYSINVRNDVAITDYLANDQNLVLALGIDLQGRKYLYTREKSCWTWFVICILKGENDQFCNVVNYIKNNSNEINDCTNAARFYTLIDVKITKYDSRHDEQISHQFSKMSAQENIQAFDSALNLQDGDIDFDVKLKLMRIFSPNGSTFGVPELSLLKRFLERCPDSSIQNLFLKGFEVICPHKTFMTLEERSRLFISLLSDKFDKEQLDYLNGEEIQEFLNAKKQDERAHNYRKYFSELIYYHCPKSIELIFFYLNQCKENERDELLLTLISFSKIWDRLNQFDNNFVSKNTRAHFESPLALIRKWPKGERLELINLVNRWFEEDPLFIEDYKRGNFKETVISVIGWNATQKFPNYRKEAINILLKTPQVNRDDCELLLRKLEHFVGLSGWKGRASEFSEWILTIPPEAKATVLKEIVTLLELCEKPTKFEEYSYHEEENKSIIDYYREIYENNPKSGVVSFAIRSPPRNISELKSILNGFNEYELWRHSSEQFEEAERILCEEGTNYFIYLEKKIKGTLKYQTPSFIMSEIIQRGRMLLVKKLIEMENSPEKQKWLLTAVNGLLVKRRFKCSMSEFDVEQIFKIGEKSSFRSNLAALTYLRPILSFPFMNVSIFSEMLSFPERKHKVISSFLVDAQGRMFDKSDPKMSLIEKIKHEVFFRFMGLANLFSSFEKISRDVLVRILLDAATSADPKNKKRRAETTLAVM